MPTQRTAVAILIFVEVAAFAAMSETVIFPTAIAVATLLGLRGPWRYRMSQDRQVILSLVAALLFVVQWRVQPHSTADDSMPYLSPFLHSLGQFLLVLQTAALYLEWNRDLLPITLPWPGVFVMVSAGDIYARPSQRFLFQLCALGFMAATAIFFLATARAASSTERRPYGAGKASVALALLFAATFAAWVASAGLQRYERTLDRLVTQLLDPAVTPSSAGFPSRSRLGSIADRKTQHAQDVALRVYSRTEPGYLRGKAYHWITTIPVYGPPEGSTQWDDSAPVRNQQLVTEVLVPTGSEGNRFRFELHQNTFALNAPSREMELWLEPSQWGTYFLPPRCAEIVTSEPEIHRDHRQVTSGTETPPVRYVAQTGPPPDPATYFDMTAGDGAFSRAALVEYPAKFDGDPLIRAILDQEFRDCRTVADHVRAVESYFRSNYGYTIGIEVPGDEDPIRYFLRRKPNAHCEYFAQGAALLLRMKGIPTRYMTGFVAAERNDYGDFWIARNEHAHAWCEAWDDELGWVVVEATPAAGIPSPGTAAWHRQLWEYLGGQIAQFRQRFAEGGWRWLLGALFAFLATPTGWMVVAFVVLYVLVRLWMQSHTATGPKVPPLIAELHRLLRRMDQRLERSGVTRRPGETLARFADRVDATTGDAEAARWYADYGQARYRGSLDEAAVAALRERLNSLRPPPRRSRDLVATNA